MRRQHRYLFLLTVLFVSSMSPTARAVTVLDFPDPVDDTFGTFGIQHDIV